MKKQNTIISAAAVLAFMYGASAILGLVRTRLLAHYFGASEILGVFYTADRIPSLIYSLLVVGTLSTVFIPVFTNTFKKNEENAWHTASSMITVSILLFLSLGTLVFILAPSVITALSLGKFTAEQIKLGTSLMRIMLSAQLLLIISSFVTVILQSFKYFIITALAPVLYNIGMILGIVILIPRYGIYGPAFGVIIGSVLHLLVQIPLIRKINFSYKFTLDFKDKGLREIFRLMPPRILGAGMAQVSAIVNNSLAILVSTSSVVIFKFADQLQSFPVNLFGASIALAALPTLSYESGEKDKEKFKEIFLTSFHQMLFLVIPASVILLVLRIPVVRLVYGVSNFPWEATVQTSYTLAFFSLSIFAQSSVYLLTRAFYALKDTATPLKVNFITVILSSFLSYVFVHYLGFGVWSVAFSYSIALLLDMIFLLLLLSKKVGGFKLDSLVVPFTKISYAAFFMGISLYVPMKLLDEFIFDTTKTVNLALLTILATLAGVISYLFFTKLFKVREIELLYKLLRKCNLAVPANMPLQQELLEE
ncbi:MAG: murein biosynthesis integral membrane protein MurJ [Patescibacteria group bacterium]